MNLTVITTADAYRMVDALRDYADILDGEGSGMVAFARNAADRIENGRRVGNGLIEVERFDLDAAHSAVIGVMCRRYEKAQALKDEAAALDSEARRLEDFLAVFAV